MTAREQTTATDKKRPNPTTRGFIEILEDLRTLEERIDQPDVSPHELRTADAYLREAREHVAGVAEHHQVDLDGATPRDEESGGLVDVVEEIEDTQARLREMDEQLTKLKVELYTGERR